MNTNCEILTLNEACKLLRVSRPTLVKLLNKGIIKGFKVGKRVWKVRRVDLELYIEKYGIT